MKKTLLILCFILGAFSGASARDGKPVTLKGQVVCSECWFEADRKTTPYGTDADLKCAADCFQKNIPPALAVAGEPDAVLYILENGKFKKNWKDWLGYVGKQVELTGVVHEKDKKRLLKVDALKVLDSGDKTSAADLPVEAPELVLRDLAGVEQKLGAYRGKVVVLNFWATWCVPCRKEMPVFTEIQNSLAAWNVQVIGASADEASKSAEVAKFVRSGKLNFPVWLGATTADMQRFGLGTELPATVVIDREGKIVARVKGVVTEKELKKHLEPLIAETKPEKEERVAANEKASTVPS